jgi:excisionase family DNA binding protein
VQDTTAKLAVSTEEAKEMLSIGRTQLFDLLRRKEITSVKVGRRRLIPAASLKAYLGGWCPTAWFGSVIGSAGGVCGLLDGAGAEPGVV